MKTTFLFLALAFVIAPALQADVLIYSNDFSGTKPWSFDSIDDPSNQLSGTGELVYNGADVNTKAWVTKDIDGSTVFASETGILELKAKFDLSNYVTTNSDFSGATFVEIATPGNKASFTGGCVFKGSLNGFNSPGEFRFGHYTAIRFWATSAGQGNTPSHFIGNKPAFPLVYDLDALIYVASSGGTGDWQITAISDWTGPVDSVGTIGTESLSTTYTRVDTGFSGLQSLTGLRVGYADARLNFGAGDSVAIDSVELWLVPEPAIGLAAFGMLLALLRRR
jgi:hypothetical protein